MNAIIINMELIIIIIVDLLSMEQWLQKYKMLTQYLCNAMFVDIKDQPLLKRRKVFPF